MSSLPALVVWYLPPMWALGKVGTWPDEQLGMVWERFWSNPTWGGKKKSLFLLLFQALSSAGLVLGFRNEVWVGCVPR